jgi:hypothetical protein
VGDVLLEAGGAAFTGHSHVQVLSLRNHFREQPASAVTVSVWLRPAAKTDDSGRAAEYAGVLCHGGCRGDRGGATFSLGVQSGAAVAEMTTAYGSAELTTARADSEATQQGLGEDRWTMLTMVYTGLEAKLYKDGALADTKPLTGRLAGSECPLTIGACGQHHFHGYIDDVRVYRRQLYAADVAALHARGRQ